MIFDSLQTESLTTSILLAARSFCSHVTLADETCSNPLVLMTTEALIESGGQTGYSAASQLSELTKLGPIHSSFTRPSVTTGNGNIDVLGSQSCNFG